MAFTLAYRDCNEVSDCCASISCFAESNKQTRQWWQRRQRSPSPVLAASREAVHSRHRIHTWSLTYIKERSSLDSSTLGDTLAHTLDLASPLTRIMAVPCNGCVMERGKYASRSLYTNYAKARAKTFRLIPRSKTNRKQTRTGKLFGR